MPKNKNQNGARQTGFIWNNATFSVRAETVADSIDASYLVYSLFGELPQREYRRAVEFITFVLTVSVSKGDPGFEIPSPDAPKEELREFYDTFLGLPRGLRDAWQVAQVRLLNGSDPDTQPGVEKKEETTESTGASDTTN